MSALSSVEEVRAVVLEGRSALAVSRVRLEDALGLVLASVVIAAHDVPPFANSAMDGYALRSVDTVRSGGRLTVVGATMAGEAPGVVAPLEAVRIMTGAPLPEGADAVVRLEETVLDRDGSVVVDHVVRPGANVRSPGEEVSAGAAVLGPGSVLGSAHIGLLASLGVSEVDAHPSPRVGVLSTGDELVSGNRALGPGEIRDANRPALLAAVREAGFVPVDLGIVGDEIATLALAVDQGLARSHALVISGGVSVGDRDAVFAALRSLTDRVRAFDVAMRPGRPFVFAEIADTPVFALPGNPAAAMIGFELFARPALRALGGHLQLERPLLRGIADEILARRRDGKVHYARVSVQVDAEGALHVRSAGAQNSHLLTASARAAGLAVLPDGEGLAPGDPVKVMVLDWERVSTPPQAATPARSAPQHFLEHLPVEVAVMAHCRPPPGISVLVRRGAA